MLGAWMEEIIIVKCEAFSLPKLHDMKTYRTVEVKLHILYTSILDGSEWLPSCSKSLYPRKICPQYSLDRRVGGPHSCFEMW
jgi:hypothetical protein